MKTLQQLIEENPQVVDKMATSAERRKRIFLLINDMAKNETDTHLIDELVASAPKRPGSWI